MMKIITRHILIVTVVTVLFFSAAAEADDDIDQDDVASLRKQGLVLPLEKILTAAQSYQTGRVIDVELEKKGGRYIYEIEIADTKGRVWEMKFDAADAALISREQDD